MQQSAAHAVSPSYQRRDRPKHQESEQWTGTFTLCASSVRTVAWCWTVELKEKNAGRSDIMFCATSVTEDGRVKVNPTVSERKYRGN